MRNVTCRSHLAGLEPLEQRTLMSGTPSILYDAHSIVRGRTVAEWEAASWQKVFGTPVYASDGTTIINPMFDEAPAHALPSDDGKITFLFGSFFGGEIHRTETVPNGQPLFFGIIGSEWSNPDTPAAPDYNTLPGNYDAAQLAHFAEVQTLAVTSLSATLDGQPIPDLFAHRETSPVFTYVLPPLYNIDQVFFGEDISGPQTPAVADGYAYILQPLSPGQHVLHFTGTSADLSGTPPQLGAFEIDMTYVLNVVPKGQYRATQVNPSSAARAGDMFNSGSRIGEQSDLDELLQVA